jgi:hypothetical protein
MKMKKELGEGMEVCGWGREAAHFKDALAPAFTLLEGTGILTRLFALFAWFILRA